MKHSKRIEGEELLQLHVEQVIGDSVVARGGLPMSDLVWLPEIQMRRIESDFQLSCGLPGVDARWIINGASS